jgi:hypothetical protein
MFELTLVRENNQTATPEKQSDMTIKEVLSTPDSEYKVVISLMKFMSIIYEFLKIIRSFP